MHPVEDMEHFSMFDPISVPLIKHIDEEYMTQSYLVFQVLYLQSTHIASLKAFAYFGQGFAKVVIGTL